VVLGYPWIATAQTAATVTIDNLTPLLLGMGTRSVNLSNTAHVAVYRGNLRSLLLVAIETHADERPEVRVDFLPVNNLMALDTYALLQ
jgi:hypothetical protein